MRWRNCGCILNRILLPSTCSTYCICLQNILTVLLHAVQIELTDILLRHHRATWTSTLTLLSLTQPYAFTHCMCFFCAINLHVSNIFKLLIRHEYFHTENEKVTLLFFALRFIFLSFCTVNKGINWSPWLCATNGTSISHCGTEIHMASAIF